MICNFLHFGVFDEGFPTFYPTPRLECLLLVERILSGKGQSLDLCIPARPGKLQVQSRAFQMNWAGPNGTSASDSLRTFGDDQSTVRLAPKADAI